MREALLLLVEELIARLELREPQSFRAGAYKRLLQTLERLPEAAFASADTLLQAVQGERGIGEGLQRALLQLYTEGRTPLLEELRKEVPDSLLELRRLPGLGPKRIHQLWKEAGITSLDALQQAIERGKLNRLAGWGPALIEQVREGLAFYRAKQRYLLYVEALALWEKATLPLTEAGLQVEPVGELRRALPLIEQVEGLIAQSQAPLAEEKGWRPFSSEELRHPEFPLRLWVAPDERWGESLLRWTGPSAFWERLQGYLPPERTGLSEEELFTKAGLPYILPSWRDWEDILELAQQKRLPKPLSETAFYGSVHVHSTYSDGADTLEALAQAAQDQGWRWLGIADHSQRAAYAGGLPPEKLLAQLQHIDQLNETFSGFQLLKGVEADILPDGRLDYDETLWQKLDYLVASVHERLRMSREEATQRLTTALQNPFVKVLGHWTGRLLRNRPGYPIEEERILALCAEKGIAIEFNANPYRMEIDWRWVRRAAEMGVRIILTTDAHRVAELSYWRPGLAVLQKGLLPPSLLLNTYPEPPFLRKR